ncbi:DUF4832 domain-containing protein [Paenibacillus arenilitoris]|uniref:DUF4832 domain-containing protein n=1 Tax=Paenibacillus arenilitoris TaxID=2772299 RepID=A0A927CJW9_9BACL|nr:DUF4832 domain-containing protein [Paenibacillus arenilitoris]MBD2867546.1 DUF4832 domain-containing protein [Paenibacillus arenilitoris]
MKQRWFLAVFVVLLTGSAALLLGRGLYADGLVPRTVHSPVESNAVLANPYMGFAVDARYDEAKQPFRLAHANLTWSELEPEKGKYAFEAIESKNNFAYWRERGVKIIIRVILDYPREDSRMDIPEWLYFETGKKGVWYDTDYGKGFSPDYNQVSLIRNHERLIAALAKRYNNDPLIAFVQLGSLGHWGEWHTRNDKQARIPFPRRAVSDQYAGHYVKYFASKPLLMRRPHAIAAKNGLGLYNDAFGRRDSTIDGFLSWYTKGYTSWLTQEKEPAMPNFWTKAPSGGEFADEKKYMRDSAIEETLRQARLTHVSWMGPNAPSLEEPGGALQKNIDRFLKTIGYRFVIAKESHEAKVKAGGALNVTIDVRNRGVAPFYFKWPIELTLSDRNGQIVAYAKPNADIRKWLPGMHSFSAKLNVPAMLPTGEYTVNAAILDPETGKPGIDFANDGKRDDGRYSLGSVSVSGTVK